MLSIPQLSRNSELKSLPPFQEIAKKELDNLEEQHQNLVNEIEDLNGKSEKLHKLYDEQVRIHGFINQVDLILIPDLSHISFYIKSDRGNATKCYSKAKLDL